MKLPHRRQFLHLAAGAAVLPVLSRIARAQAYPTRAIRFILPFPAGGPLDVLARLYGQKLSQSWNKPVMVETRAGATGTIGTEAVARAPSDGYTLLFTVDLPITMAPALLKLHYDPLHDLIPIAAVAKLDNILVVHPSTGIRSVADLVAAAKAKPGMLTVYPLGVTGVKSSPLLPNLAPLSATYPGLIISTWFGLWAPAGTPASVTALLHNEISKIYSRPEVQQRLLPLGLDPEWMSGLDVSQRIVTDSAKWRDFIKTAGIHLE